MRRTSETALKDFARAEHLVVAWGDLSETRAQEILIAGHEHAASYEGLCVHKEWRSGNPAAEIVPYAREKQVDVIVVGNAGHSRLASALLGSVAFKLLATAPCPLTVVR